MRSRNAEILSLIKAGAKDGINIDVARTDGATPLFIAAQKGHLDVVNALLAKDGININTARTDGATPLFIAAQKGHLDVVNALLAKDGININAARTSGATPLYIATQYGHLDVVNALLAKDGININAACTDGATPLFIAALNGHLGVVNALLAKNGININAAFTDGATPLFIAALNGHLGVVNALLAKDGININAACTDGATPLFIAAQQGHFNIINALLAKDGININAACTSTNGATPLFIAARYGHLDIVNALLAKDGININAACTSGATPLSIATQKGHHGIVKALKEYESKQISAEKISELKKKVANQYLALNENRVLPSTLHQIFIEFSRDRKSLLRNILDDLQNRRDTLKKDMSQSEFISQTKDPTTPLGKLSALITIGNSLLNFPKNPITKTSLQEIDIPEAKDILLLLEQQRAIDAFVEKIKTHLINLEKTINTTKWKVKNLSGVILRVIIDMDRWTNGTPSHMSKINRELEKITSINSHEEIVLKYGNVIYILDEACDDSDDRHLDTLLFYLNKLDELRNINFAAPVILSVAAPSSVPPLSPASLPPNSNRTAALPPSQLSSLPEVQHYPILSEAQRQEILLIRKQYEESISTLTTMPPATFCIPAPHFVANVAPPSYASATMSADVERAARLRNSLVFFPAAVPTQVRAETENTSSGQDLATFVFPEVPPLHSEFFPSAPASAPSGTTAVSTAAKPSTQLAETLSEPQSLR